MIFRVQRISSASVEAGVQVMADLALTVLYSINVKAEAVPGLELDDHIEMRQIS